jgi:hypothetical protein
MEFNILLVPLHEKSCRSTNGGVETVNSLLQYSEETASREDNRPQ